jgi:hypothetical protein
MKNFIMKSSFFIIILFATFVFSSCKVDNSVGFNIQPSQDEIIVVVDTFWLSSTDFIYDSISAQCNDSLSMLLGEYYNAKYGTTKADLIVQIAPPLNYKFPDEATYNPQPDSVVMLLFYTQWYGSEKEPLEIAVYELDKATPKYSEFYPATFDIEDFIEVKDNLLLGSKIMTSVDQTLPDSIKYSQGTGVLHSIRYKFNDIWKQNFFDIVKQPFSNINDFLNEFKGFYITTKYGQSTMLYLLQIDMRFYYHYTYKKNGVDTIVNSYIEFPANKEVRQLNRILHTDMQNIINRRDSVNYIKTGGGIYPKITLPVGSMRQQIADKTAGKIMSINSAILSIEATETDSSKMPVPVPATLLLLPTTEIKNFFEINGIAAVSGDKGIIASYSSTKKEYTFDIAHTLSGLLKDAEHFPENVEYILVPVDIHTINGVVSDIKPQKYIGGVTIRSGKNNYSPMRIEMVYSGF